MGGDVDFDDAKIVTNCVDAPGGLHINFEDEFIKKMRPVLKEIEMKVSKQVYNKSYYQPGPAFKVGDNVVVKNSSPRKAHAEAKITKLQLNSEINCYEYFLQGRYSRDHFGEPFPEYVLEKSKHHN